MVTIRDNPILDEQKERKKEFYQICKKGAENVEKIIPKNEINDIIVIEERLGKLVANTVNQVRKFILQSVEEVITDTLNHYNDLHEKMAGERLPKTVIKQLKSELLKEFAYQSFKGDTFDGRIEKIRRKVFRNIVNTLPTENKPSSLKPAVKECIYTFDHIPGGSLRGLGETLLVSEENRFYHKTAITYFNKVGITFLRFCLLPAHSETTDMMEYASAENEEIKSKFPDYDPIGIYRIKAVEYPRPRARYYLEPLYHIGYLGSVS